jgi:hypothetical protein
MDEIQYELIICQSDESLNIDLLQKNIEKFGTIFNTVKACCTVSGTIKKIYRAEGINLNSSSKRCYA